MPVDHADNTAATTAGYSKTSTDLGITKSPRYQAVYEKHLVGEAGGSGGPFRAYGTSDISQADADAKALSSLNAQLFHEPAWPSNLNEHSL